MPVFGSVKRNSSLPWALMTDWVTVSGKLVQTPLGNLMLRYAPDAPAQDTLKDLERLLKASKNWIKGGTNGHR